MAAAGPDVHVYTRNGLDWTDKFKPLVNALTDVDKKVQTEAVDAIGEARVGTVQMRMDPSRLFGPSMVEGECCEQPADGSAPRL